MDSIWEKLGYKATAFRKLSEPEKNDILRDSFQDALSKMPAEEKQQIMKMIRQLLVKNGTQQAGVIRNFGERSILAVIGHVGILLAGMSDEAIDKVAYDRKKRRMMEAEVE